jgi:DNA-binding transcriptional LysR family regulator
MKLEQLRDVVAIAECGGMRAAARVLGVPQPALTRNLRNLEREIGFQIFDRRRHGMVVTERGRTVLDHARRILDEMRALSEAIGADARRDGGPGTAAKRRATAPEIRTEHVFIDLVLETFRLNGKLMAAGDRLVKPINLTSSRWQVLGSLPRDQATVSQIARHMGLQRQSIQRTIGVLCREGLVRLVDNPRHRRAKLAALTPKGWAVIREANRLRDLWTRRTTVGISAAELEAAYQVLRRIGQRLDEAESL